MSVTESTSAVILFDCPSCGGGLGIPEDLVGVQGPCPFCRAEIWSPNPRLGIEARLSQNETAWNPWSEVASPPTERINLWDKEPEELSDFNFPPPPPVFDEQGDAGQAISIPEPSQSVEPGPQLESDPWVTTEPPVETSYTESAVESLPAFPIPDPSPFPPPPSLKSEVEPPAPSPPDRPAAPQDEQPSLCCGSCGISLDIDPNSQLTGGPCPACEVWIDLSGRPQAKTSFIPDLRKPPTQRIPLPQAPFTPADEPRVQTQPPSASHGERRVRRTTKRRRVLPEECYVGTAAQRRPSAAANTTWRGRQRPEAEASFLSRKLIKTGVLLVAIALPIALGLVIAFKLHFLKSDSFSFWNEPRVIHPNLGTAVLEASTQVEHHRDETLERARALVYEFLESPHWGRQEPLLLNDLIPENEPVIAALRVFPCESYAEGAMETISAERIPLSEQFLFNLRVSPQGSDVPAVDFLAEEMKDGDIKIHALHLYQSWKGSLTHFLETPGAEKGRFYTQVALAKEIPGEDASFRLPEDSRYRKLRLKDPFNHKYNWRTNGYVRTEGAGSKKTPSWAAYVLLNKLNEMDWSRAVLDLEWRQGPDGDFFIEVRGVQGCNWGDFPR